MIRLPEPWSIKIEMSTNNSHFLIVFSASHHLRFLFLIVLIEWQFPGYATLKGGAGGYRMATGANGDPNPSSSRLKDHFGFSSVTPSSLGMLSRISEVDDESSIATDLDDDEKRGNGNSEPQLYNMGFPFKSWSDHSQFQQTLTGHKRELDSEGNKLFANAQVR